MVAALVKQEAREDGKMLTAFATSWGSSRCGQFVEGRSGPTWIAHRSPHGVGRALVVVVGEATGRAEAK